MLSVLLLFVFFFQAEDGIRDATVTGVQTCALPIYPGRHDPLRSRTVHVAPPGIVATRVPVLGLPRRSCAGPRHAWIGMESVLCKIGRASCREREERGGAGENVERERKEHVDEKRER